MDTSSRDRITVDLQGLKGALVARAEADGVLPSDVIRQALAAWLQVESRPTSQNTASTNRKRPQRLCLRMRPEEVRAVLSSAALAGQRPSRWLARVAAGGLVSATADQLDAQHTALVALTAELASLRRVLQRLALHSETGPRTVAAEGVTQVLSDLRALLASAATAMANRPVAGRAAALRMHGRSFDRSAT